jgi:1,4-dihydroxy-2-naphthoate octaprenyltransferase
MNFKTFLNFTRIQTLPVALLSPIAGVLFSIYKFRSFHFWPTLLFFIGLAAINLFVSAWNNLMDYRKALDPEYKKHDNILSNRKINPALALRICLILLGIDVLVGMGVLLTTNLAILPIGGICFLVAIFYTYGPFAFSRWPLGELLAGLCEGFFGFILGFYINSFDKNYFVIDFHGMTSVWLADWSVILPVMLVALMCFCMNFNVMLSDNICDLEQDLRNGRKTLPYFLGVPRALILYVIMYSLAACCIGFAIVLNVLPIWSLLMLLIVPLVITNIRKFLQVQVKSQTFILQIRTLVLYNGALALTILVGILLRK